MQTDAMITEHGSEEMQGMEVPTQTTYSTDIPSLDSHTMKIRALEDQLTQQRMDTTTLTMELALLHDAPMRELLALCTQGCKWVSKKIEEYKILFDQLSPEIRSGFQHDYDNPLKNSSQSISLEDPSNPPGDHDLNSLNLNV
ncbi:uncharacterized protein LOC123515175 [Portunus trituberculatus]|uniref:uncharacterized protein LOC123515175 n=1 Tax=Portunus trituberculatus TaxID=210409 RepID=UPI001E1CF987|nr:uncharacterized protein LOC123515175 [Portunus trituberculatus]